MSRNGILRLGLSLIAVSTALSSFASAASPKVSVKASLTAIIEELRPNPDLSLVENFLNGAPKVDPSLSPEAKAKILSDYIFGQWKIEPDNSYASREQKDNVLPDSVLKVRRGHCLGITSLYLLAAEKAGVSAKFVRAPDHVFLRVCDSSRCVNVETLKSGAVVPDDYYIKNLVIPKLAIDRNIYLRSLTSPKELVASAYLGLGYIAAHANQNALGALFYRKAIEASPDYAEPYSNLASLEWDFGNKKEALKLLKRALELNPIHYATLINLGIIAEKAGKAQEAVGYYDRALESNPLSIQGYWRRSAVLGSERKFSAALLDLEKILVIQPKACDAIARKAELLRTLKKPVPNAALDSLKQLQSSGSCRAL